MKKLIYTVLLISTTLYSQNPTSNSRFYNFDIKSPGITDFIKYGNMSSLSFTGNIDFSIPLIEESTINLNYDSSGFRPSKRSGLVGLNWYLNMGGAITREVNGMPDDQMGEPNSNGSRKETNGFIVGVRNKIHTKENVFNFNLADVMENLNLDFYLKGTNIYNHYEGNPDMFSFNFNGITGKFFMGNDGLIKVISNQQNNLKIDITGMQNQNIIDDSKPNESLIIITDDSGNKFYFGGHTKNLEYTANGSYPIITTWHLNKIEYYNGKITNFIFRDDSELSPIFDTPFDNVPNHYGFTNLQTNPNPTGIVLNDFCVMHEYVSDQRQINQVSNYSPFFGSTGSNSSSGGIQMTTTLQKIAILDQINSDDFIINFSYSRQAHKFNTSNSTSINNTNNSFFKEFLDIKLDKIELYNKNGLSIGNLIKTIDFGYSYLGGTIHSRMFLTTLKETGKPAYQFSYNDTSNLPLPITFGVDHWGFWNGKSDNNNNLIPYQNYQTNGDYSDCSTTSNAICSTRNPNFNYTLKGILEKVVYPTGGYTRFEYELNDYAKRLEVRSVNNYIPAIYDVVNQGGGLRIKKIIESSDGVIETNEKLYEYKNDLGQSSGVLLTWPRYAIHWRTGTSGYYQDFVYIRSNPIGRHILDAPILTYSQVTEKTNSNGKKVVKFTDYNSNPDDFNDSFKDHSLGTTAIPKNLGRNYIGIFLNDKSIERGKLSWEKLYDANNNLVQQTNYTYNIDPLKTNNWSAKLHLSGPSVQANKIYFYNDYLTEKKVTHFTNTGNFITTEKSTFISAPTYNSTLMSNQDILSETSTTSSINNEIIKTEYKYPWQNYLSSNPLYINFATANIMYPIREIQYRNAIKLSEKFTLFAKDASTNSLMLPKSIYSAKFPNSFANITNIGNLEKKFTYDFYDSKGNVSQYTQENGISVAIIWGYNKSQPIAKIENATLAQVATALSTTISALQTTYNETNLTSLNGLRSSLPNAMVTTYVHLPLIGVSTITDSKGDISTYTYDANNRLKDVKDKNGNVLTDYQYHYKNQ